MRDAGRARTVRDAPAAELRLNLVPEVHPIDAAANFGHKVRVEHARPRSKNILRPQVRVRARRRVRGAGQASRRVPEVVAVPADRQVISAARLNIDTPQPQLGDLLVENVELLPGHLRNVDEDVERVPLVLIRAEEQHLVLLQRTAQRAAHLLIRVRQNRLRDEVLGRQLGVAEVAVGAAGELVGAGLRDRVHLHPERSALRDVEHVGDDLEFRDSIAAQLRLGAVADRADARRDLLAVEIQLELVGRADARGVRRHVIGRDALHQHRQLEPVPAGQRHVRHLLPVDVAGHLRRGGVHERRLARDRQGLRDARQLQRERHADVLADEHLHIGIDDRREPAQLRLHFVGAGRDVRNAVLAAFIGHRLIRTARAHLCRGHDRAREHGLRFVGHGAGKRSCVLSERGHRYRERDEQEYDAPYDPSHVAPFAGTLVRAAPRPLIINQCWMSCESAIRCQSRP